MYTKHALCYCPSSYTAQLWLCSNIRKHLSHPEAIRSSSHCSTETYSWFIPWAEAFQHKQELNLSHLIYVAFNCTFINVTLKGFFYIDFVLSPAWSVTWLLCFPWPVTLDRMCTSVIYGRMQDSDNIHLWIHYTIDRHCDTQTGVFTPAS